MQGEVQRNKMNYNYGQFTPFTQFPRCMIRVRDNYIKKLLGDSGQRVNERHYIDGSERASAHSRSESNERLNKGKQLKSEHIRNERSDKRVNEVNGLHCATGEKHSAYFYLSLLSIGFLYKSMPHALVALYLVSRGISSMK